MISAKIDENGIVLNTIIATPQEAEEAFGGVWVECPEWVGIGMDINTPEPIIVTPTAEENKQTAIDLLQQTDWTTIADVGNPEMSNPYLANQAAFIQWRSQVRAIAVTPVDGTLDIFNQMPQEIWQTV